MYTYLPLPHIQKKDHVRAKDGAHSRRGVGGMRLDPTRKHQIKVWASYNTIPAGGEYTEPEFYAMIIYRGLGTVPSRNCHTGLPVGETYDAPWGLGTG
jgi:hypothetical protein